MNEKSISFHEIYKIDICLNRNNITNDTYLKIETLKSITNCDEL